MMLFRFVFLSFLIALAGEPLPARAPVVSHPRVEYLRMVPSVREFTKPRRFFSKIVSWPAGPDEEKPELLRPYATAQDSMGRLLVADPGEHGSPAYTISKNGNTSS